MSSTETGQQITPTNAVPTVEPDKDNEPASGQDFTRASTGPTVDLEKDATPEPPWKPGRGEWLIMITLCISSLTVALDSSILVPVLPTLAVSLNGSAVEAFWAGTSYLLASAVVQPFIASLSDIFGRRELLVPCLLLFTIASIICAVAQSFTTLLVGRVIQGIGGGGIITLAQIIFGDIIPLRQRPRYFSIVLLAWAIGSLLGPVVGGAFAQEATWRWCFWLNLPICGIALPMSFFFVKLHTERKSLLEKLRMVDWTGGFIFIGSLTTALVAISNGGIENPWDSWRTLVPLIIGITGTIISLLYERYVARFPFLYRSLFCNFSAIVTYLSALFQGLILLTGLYYVVFYFSSTQLKSPLDAGVAFLPAMVFVLPGSVVVSGLITRFGRYRWAIWIGWAITTLGCGLLMLLDENTSTAVHSTALAVVGLGLGMILSSVNFAVQASVTDTKDSGSAAAMYAFMRTLGMTLGVAFGGTIFQNLLKQRLNDLDVPNADAIARNAEAFVEETLRDLAPTDPLRIAVLDAYASGFRGVWIAMTIVSAVALVGSVFIKHFSLDKILDSKFRLEKDGEAKTQQGESPT